MYTNTTSITLFLGLLEININKTTCNVFHDVIHTVCHHLMKSLWNVIYILSGISTHLSRKHFQKVSIQILKCLEVLQFWICIKKMHLSVKDCCLVWIIQCSKRCGKQYKLLDKLLMSTLIGLSSLFSSLSFLFFFLNQLSLLKTYTIFIEANMYFIYGSIVFTRR